MATLMQQQPTMRTTALETIPQKRFPLVHVLTSKTESDEIKSHLIDRRIRLCQKLCRHYQNGFAVKDLHYLMKIFNILGELCQQ
ncbi:unnamed protein product, partial [Rotaria sp. Silwood2]